MDFELLDKIVIGSGLKSANLGLIGCMRNIKINGLLIEPRFVIMTERVVGEVAIDDCRYVDPCTRPNTCEHGGICSVREDRVICNCENTGKLISFSLQDVFIFIYFHIVVKVLRAFSCTMFFFTFKFYYSLSFVFILSCNVLFTFLSFLNARIEILF